MDGPGLLCGDLRGFSPGPGGWVDGPGAATGVSPRFAARGEPHRAGHDEASGQPREDIAMLATTGSLRDF